MGAQERSNADDSLKNEETVDLEEPRVDSVAETLGRILSPTILLGAASLFGLMGFVVVKGTLDTSFDFTKVGKVLEEAITQQFVSSEKDILSTFLAVSAALLGAIVTAYVALVLSQRDRVLENRRLFSLAAVLLTGLWVPFAVLVLVWLIQGGRGIVAGILVPLCLGVVWFAVVLGRFGRATKQEAIDFTRIQLNRAVARTDRALAVLRNTSRDAGGLQAVAWWRVIRNHTWRGKCCRIVGAATATAVTLTVLSSI